MDHNELFEAVKGLASDMEICVDVEVWGNSKGCHSETTWQIYLSVPGVFFRGATPEEALAAFTAVYGSKSAIPTEERERAIDAAVADLISSRQNINAQEAIELGMQLAAQVKLDPEICEHLLFWYSRMFPDDSKVARPTYGTWLSGAARGTTVSEIMLELAPAEPLSEPSPITPDVTTELQT